MNYDLLILYSGGADSRMLLELALNSKNAPYCLLIDYGQLHKEELNFAAQQLQELNIDYQIVKIVDLKVNSGLTGDGVKNASNDVHEMHVPSRNLIFTGIAASIAESKNIKKIWYGADFSDFINKFPDCMHEWVYRVNQVLEINGPFPISFEAPLLGFSKELVLDCLKKFGVKEDELFSGYGDL